MIGTVTLLRDCFCLQHTGIIEVQLAMLSKAVSYMAECFKRLKYPVVASPRVVKRSYALGKGWNFKIFLYFITSSFFTCGFECT